MTLDLDKRIQLSIDSLRRNIIEYVFEENDSAYLVVAVELRKLLLDVKTEASFEREKGKKTKRSLFETHYGSGKQIYLRSFLSPNESGSDINTDSHVDVNPTIYKSRHDILYNATHGGRLVNLMVWLDEAFVHDKRNAILKVRTVLGQIADKEGAHIIDRRVWDKREDVRVAFSEAPMKGEAPESLNFVEHWEQFVIDAGMRVLDGKMGVDNRPLIEHGIVVPDAPIDITKVQKVLHSRTQQ